eukprot:6391524-Pyramimonas_sp.AAC.1
MSPGLTGAGDLPTGWADGAAPPIGWADGVAVRDSPPSDWSVAGPYMMSSEHTEVMASPGGWAAGISSG